MFTEQYVRELRDKMARYRLQVRALETALRAVGIDPAAVKIQAHSGAPAERAEADGTRFARA